MNTDTLEYWKGSLGDQYTERNQPPLDSASDFFESALQGLDITTVLEVGCNRGHNLTSLQYLGYMVRGIEPNKGARTEARMYGLEVQDGDIRTLHIRPRYDLVFTAGVLIHVPPADISRAMDNLIRASRRYVMFIEYEADDELEIPYRGLRNILWKRPYRVMYENSGLQQIRGNGADPALFPGCTWGLFSKPA